MSNMPCAPQCLQRTLAAAMVVAAAASATCDGARAEYPERQITMVVCFPAGGGTDIAARLINTSLGEALGKPVIVENRGGAGGNIAIAAAARAGGDGYTLLVCSSAYVVNPSLYAHAGYDPYKDFVPVMVIGASPNVFVVPAQSETMVAAMRSRGVPVAYLAFEGEGHGFRKLETIRRSLEAELYFYGRVFGFTPADAMEPIDIVPDPAAAFSAT